MWQLNDMVCEQKNASLNVYKWDLESGSWSGGVIDLTFIVVSCRLCGAFLDHANKLYIYQKGLNL